MMTLDPHDDPGPPLVLDLSGARWPSLLLRVAAAIETLPPGAVLDVTASDPLYRFDVPLFARRRGHGFVEREEDADRRFYRFSLRRGRAFPAGGEGGPA
jgi:TusA-related sulfurtransferase